MHNRFCVRGIIALVIAGVTVPCQSSTPLAADWWPFKVGNTWTIDTQVMGQKMVQVITVKKVSKSGGKTTATLEYRTDGKPTQEETYVVDSTGMVRLNSGPNGANKINPPFPVIKLPLTSGKNWTWKGSVIMNGVTVQGSSKTSVSGPETLKTPAGTFRPMKVHVALTVSMNGQSLLLENDYWFAQGVGLVRQYVHAGNMVVDGSVRSYKLK